MTNSSKKQFDGLSRVLKKVAILEQKITGNPNFPQQMKNFAGSMGHWAGGGFKRVQQHVYERRLAICRKCQFWEEEGNLGMGKCLKCGCGKGKHWLPHEQCPIGLWGKENT
jgi:hypothetical protein